MKLGDKIRQLREESGLTQGQLAGSSSVSQGYLSQLENGEVKNPSAAVQAMHVDADELFEAAGYPTVRTLRQIYQEYQATIDDDLLRYLSRLPRDRQRRLLFLLEGMEKVLSADDNGSKITAWDGAEPANGSVSAPQRGKTLHYTRAHN